MSDYSAYNEETIEDPPVARDQVSIGACSARSIQPGLPGGHCELTLQVCQDQKSDGGLERT